MMSKVHDDDTVFQNAQSDDSLFRVILCIHRWMDSLHNSSCPRFLWKRNWLVFQLPLVQKSLSVHKGT